MFDKKRYFAVCSITTMLMLACSVLSTQTPKLSNEGVYLIRDQDYIELKQYIGTPDIDSILPSLEVTSTHPSFLVWYPQINQQYFMLVNLKHPGVGLPYSIDTKDENKGIYEIIPNKALDNDNVYCLYQGDPLGSPYSLPFWCFRVEGNSAQASANPTGTAITPALGTTNTPKPSSEITKLWSIKTGDIVFLGVDADGKIYGVGPHLYAVFSPDGKILQTNEIDIDRCLRGAYGGSGDVESDHWYIIKPDGTILASPLGGVCKISPGDPPIIEAWPGIDYFPYSDTVSPYQIPSAPDGFINLSSYDRASSVNPYLYHSRRSESNVFINPKTKVIAFVDHNAQLRYFDLPQDLDLDRNLLRFSITPWDDVYYSYDSYDSIGNKLGSKEIKVEQDGSFGPVTKLPQLGTLNTVKDINGLAAIDPVYLPEKQELYFYQQDSLSIYDLDFNFIGQYKLPSDFPKITHGHASSTKIMFVGHDQQLYVFDTDSGIHHEQILTKYFLPYKSTSTIPTKPTLETQPSPSATLLSEFDNLKITGCAFDSDCTSAVPIWDIANFQSMTSPGINEQEVSISIDDAIHFRTGWCTTSEEILEQNLSLMDYFVKINNIDYSGRLISKKYLRKSDGSPCINVGISVSGWELGKTYQIDFGFKILETINDGWGPYEAGDYIDRFILIVH